VEDERFYSIEDIARLLNVSDGAVRNGLKPAHLRALSWAVYGGYEKAT